jgi:FAD/FMN-containing dehydrogenase
VHALERTGEILDAAAALAPALPSSVELAAFLAAAPPPVAARAAASGGRACIISATAFADDDAEAAAALVPLAESPVARGCLLAEERRPISLEALFELTAAAFPERHRYLAEAVWTNTRPATALAGLAERLVAAPSPSALVICGLPTGSARPLPDVALSMPGGMLVLCYAVWENPRDDVANHEWHHAAVAALEPFVVGRYVGESERGVTASRAVGAFSTTSWQRLEVLRRTWDPDGLFQGWLADAPA